ATTGCPAPAPAAELVAQPSSSGAVGTTGRTIATAPGPVATAVPPDGINNAWIRFDGRRWVADGKAIERTSDMHDVGEYHGFPVYARGSDRATIYVPSTSDLVVPYVKR